MSELSEFRGVALVQRDGEDLLAFAGGTTGSDPDEACGLSTRFQIASVSKQFTAAAVLLLAERGVLAVSDPAGRWLPDGPAGWDQVTVHHLLSHTSGLPHWRDLPDLDLTAPASTGELFGRLRSAGLLFPPGQQHSYSSPGYVLLAHIVEQESGLPHARFLDQEIFRPLGLTSTFAGDPAGQSGLARGHRRGEPVTSFELNSTGKGTGDVWSTVRDLAAWDRALARGQFLTDESRQAMFAAQAAVTDNFGLPVRTHGYGYGWFLGTGPADRILIFHPGDNAGFIAFNAWAPEDDTRLIMLTNDDDADQAIAVIRQLLSAASDRATPAPMLDS